MREQRKFDKAFKEQKYTMIPLKEWEKFTDIFYLLHLEEDEFFIKSGEKPSRIGFVVSGILRLFYLSDTGNEYIKSFCIENDFLLTWV